MSWYRNYAQIVNYLSQEFNINCHDISATKSQATINCGCDHPCVNNAYTDNAFKGLCTPVVKEYMLVYTSGQLKAINGYL